MSRIVGKLLESGLVERGREGIRVADANLLLDSWHEVRLLWRREHCLSSSRKIGVPGA